MNRDELLTMLEKVPTSRLMAGAWKATLRLHIWMTGRTHELMLGFAKDARAVVLNAAGADQVFDPSSTYKAQTRLLKLWADVWDQWQAEFQSARRETAKIAFGVQAVSHDRLVMPLIVTEGIASAEKHRLAMTESKVTDGIYDPQLRILLTVAEQYIYGDGVTLDARLWKIDRETRDMLNQVLMNGMANGKSAWQIAQDIEMLTGAGQDCPRWTSTRLYGRTKKEIAGGDVTGLLRGDACDGSGVSYKALRLARTEIQKIHSLATDRMMAQQPWIEKEKINLSAAHPQRDICDDTVEGGENGEGIYTKGEIELPFHPNCLCYKTAVLMDRQQFSRQLNDWLNGGTWAEMDAYASQLGVPLDTSLSDAAINLAVWLFSDELNDWMNV